MARESQNTVHLRGRVSGAGQERVLPSGDIVVTLRVVVARPARRRPSAGEGSRPRTEVDTIEVACWTAATRRVASSLADQDVAEVDGALRRRFFQAGGRPVSRYEVEASAVRRVRGSVQVTGGRRGGASAVVTSG